MDTLTDDEKTQVLEKNAIIKLGMVARIMRCIEIATAKAAFGPTDMTLVGGVYDALLKGLNEAFDEEIKKKSEGVATEPVTEPVTEPAVVEEPTATMPLEPMSPVVEEPAMPLEPMPPIAFPSGLAGQQ